MIVLVPLKKNKRALIIPFDKGKFVSYITASGMAEAQAELLAENQANMFQSLASKQDIADMNNGLKAEHIGLRQELDAKIIEATNMVRREVNDQIQSTRLLIDDVQADVRKSEARLEGAMKNGFAAMDHKFNVLAVSNMAVIIAVMVFMAFLFRG